MNFYHLIASDSFARLLAREFRSDRELSPHVCPQSVFPLRILAHITRQNVEEKNLVSRRDTKKSRLIIHLLRRNIARVNSISRNAKGGRDIHVIGDGIRCGASIIKRPMNDEGLRIPQDSSRFIRRRRHLDWRQGSSVKSPLIGLTCRGQYRRSSTYPECERRFIAEAEINVNEPHAYENLGALDVYLERRKYLRMYVIILQLN